MAIVSRMDVYIIMGFGVGVVILAAFINTFAPSIPFADIVNAAASITLSLLVIFAAIIFAGFDVIIATITRAIEFLVNVFASAWWQFMNWGDWQYINFPYLSFVWAVDKFVELSESIIGVNVFNPTPIIQSATSNVAGATAAAATSTGTTTYVAKKVKNGSEEATTTA